MFCIKAIALALMVLQAESATRNVAKPRDHVQHSPHQQPSPAAFLGKNSKSSCAAPDDCSPALAMVLATNDVLKESEEVEKAAEKAETMATEAKSQVAKVKSAIKNEAGAVAEQTATQEKAKAVEEEVKNEDAEIKTAEKVQAEEEIESKAAKTPEAKETLKENAADTKKEVQEQVIEKKIKEEEKEALDQKVVVATMNAITDKADVEAEEGTFKKEEEMVKNQEKLAEPKKIYDVDLKSYKVKKKVLATKPAALPAIEEIKNAELAKLDQADANTKEAKVQIQEAEKTVEKAKEQFKETVQEGEKEEEMDKIVADMGSVKALENSLKKCKPCIDEQKAKAALTVAPSPAAAR